jgi:hypothetical protein
MALPSGVADSRSDGGAKAISNACTPLLDAESGRDVSFFPPPSGFGAGFSLLSPPAITEEANETGTKEKQRGGFRNRLKG